MSEPDASAATTACDRGKEAEPWPIRSRLPRRQRLSSPIWPRGPLVWPANSCRGGIVNTGSAEPNLSTSTTVYASGPPPRLSRRRFLSWATAGAASATGLLVVACGPSLSPLAPTAVSTSAPTSAPAPTPAAAPTAAPAAPTAPAGDAATPTAAAAPKPTVAPAAKPKPTGQVIVGLSQEPTVFNPLMAHIEVDEGLHHNVIDPLWGSTRRAPTSRCWQPRFRASRTAVSPRMG